MAFCNNNTLVVHIIFNKIFYKNKILRFTIRIDNIKQYFKYNFLSKYYTLKKK